MHLYVELLGEYGDEQACAQTPTSARLHMHLTRCSLLYVLSRGLFVFVFLLFFPFMRPLVSFF